jgi:hypothetical protein
MRGYGGRVEMKAFISPLVDGAFLAAWSVAVIEALPPMGARESLALEAVKVTSC